MQKDAVQKLLFVINPISGGKEKQDWETSIREYFKDLPHQIEFYLLQGENDSDSIRHYIERIEPHKVVAVGGDGTVKLLAELIKNKPTILGVLPAGSANGMARELNLPPDRNKALDVILNGNQKAIDVVQINNQEICIHLSDIGLNAMLVHYFENAEGRGMWTYLRGSVKMLLQKQTINAIIETDKESIRRKAYMVVLANASKYGTGATINPDGKIDDGLMEVVIVRKLNFWSLLNMLIAHRNFDKEKVEIISAKTVELSVSKRIYFQVDGEYRGRVKKITAHVVAACLQVMTPRDEEQAIAKVA